MNYNFYKKTKEVGLNLQLANMAIEVHKKKFYIFKNRVNAMEGKISRKQLTKLLKRAEKLGFGSKSWIVINIKGDESIWV